MTARRGDRQLLDDSVFGGDDRLESLTDQLAAGMAAFSVVAAGTESSTVASTADKVPATSMIPGVHGRVLRLVQQIVFEVSRDAPAMWPLS